LNEIYLDIGNKIYLNIGRCHQSNMIIQGSGHRGRAFAQILFSAVRADSKGFRI
jgi:hypothetical protein